MKIIFSAISDPGQVRTNNEDNYIALSEANIFVVADGMGGHAAGEIASQMTIDAFKYFHEENTASAQTVGNEGQKLLSAIKYANQKIYEAQLFDLEKRGMGTTIVALIFYGKQVGIAHVGDSRIYRIRKNIILQMTEDHSLINDYKKMAPDLTLEELESLEQRFGNIIVRALGLRDDVVIDYQEDGVKAFDYYLLCSDGLTDLVYDQELLEIIQKNGNDLGKSAQELVNLANHRGGKDNITLIIIKTLEP